MFVLTLPVNSDIGRVLSQPEEQSSHQLNDIRIVLSGNIITIFMPFLPSSWYQKVHRNLPLS